MYHGLPISADFFDYGVGAPEDDGQYVPDSNAAAAPAPGGIPPGADDTMLYFDDPTTTLYGGFDNMSGTVLAADPVSAMAVDPLVGTMPPSGDALFPPLLSPGVFGAGMPDGLPKLPASRAIDSSTDTARGDAGGSSFGQDDLGAGPQPVVGLSQLTNGSAATGGTGSLTNTLGEFTRRKGWSAKVVEELQDLLHIIEPNGRIRFASPIVRAILGYTPDEMAGQVLIDLVHPDDRSVLMSELNACIANGSIMRLFLRLRKKDATYAILETVGHAHIAASRFAPNPTNQSPFCQAVFLMSRPYPTKNARLLDSFLEHKIENERLRRRIEELRREEESESRDNETYTQSQSQSQLWRSCADSRSELAPSEAPSAPIGGRNLPGAPTVIFHGAGTPAQDGGSGSKVPAAAAASMGLVGIGPLTPATGPGGFMQQGPQQNVALTRENLEGIAARRPDSLHDKMARYEGMPAPAVPTAPVAMAGEAGAGSGSGGGSGSALGKRAGGVGMTSHTDTIEMLTGLRYQEGERSKGLSTGHRSPQLVRGDAGIEISANRDQRVGEKKKKIRLVEEYVCTDCGTLQSPEWRKGPSGPKTLCNACGLRWAKKEKKEKQKNATAEGPPPRKW